MAELPVDYLYEEPPAELFARLLPRYVQAQVFRALAESAASEHAARMTAMDSATNNAGRIDRQAYAVYEQGSPGRDHQGNHRGGQRGGFGRVIAPRAASKQSQSGLRHVSLGERVMAEQRYISATWCR